jgi:hypothetical protein
MRRIDILGLNNEAASGSIGGKLRVDRRGQCESLIEIAHNFCPIDSKVNKSMIIVGRR